MKHLLRAPAGMVMTALAGVALLGPAFARGQSQLPPGTESPDTQAPAATPGRTQGPTVAPELAQAEAKIEEQDYVAARPLVEHYLSRNPHDGRGLFDLGYLDQAAKHDDAAIDDYRKAVQADPKQFEARLALGLMLAQRNKLNEAREQLQQATLLTPSIPNPTAQAQAFRALAELDRTNNPEASRDALLSALRLSPETPQDLLLTGQIAEASGDDETAESAYRRLLAQQPESSLGTEATSGLAHLLVERKQYPQAETLLESALQRDPDSSELDAQLATVLIAQGKNQDALPVLEKLHSLEPKDAAVDRMLADGYSEAGHPEKADPIFAALVQAQPGDEELLTSQGKNFIRERSYPQAQEVFTRAVKLKAEDGDAWWGLAFAASQNKDYATALEALSMRAKYLPETPGSYFLRATSYDNLRQFRPAEEYYEKFIESAGGKFPDQEWQAKERLATLKRMH